MDNGRSARSAARVAPREAGATMPDIGERSISRGLRSSAQRRREIATAFAFWPWEVEDVTRAGRRSLIRRMEIAIGRERDPARQGAMAALLRLERRELAMIEEGLLR